jgi:hypothetical protein
MTTEGFYAHALLGAFRSQETANAIRPLRLKSALQTSLGFVWGISSIRDHEP